MICVDLGKELLLISQIDHAHLAGEILSLWKSDRLISHRYREELLFAAYQHDNGWLEADSAPRLHPRGDRPHDFLSMPEALRLEIWERGTARFASSHPFASWLISEHALRLLSAAGKTAGGPARQVMDRLRHRREELGECVGLTPEELSESYRWIQLSDFLSLAVCNRWQQPFEWPELRGGWEDGILWLDPFPLAGTTQFEIAHRRIERRRFAGDADLGTAVAAARWRRQTVRVCPLRA